MIKREIHIFLTSLMFYTRIPVPKNITHSSELLNKATRYFPFIGWIVGGVAALVFWLLSYFLPLPLAILFSMVASILATGAFHEDGFADVCDAFGGGWTKEQILKIMKDSRIGTYGTVGLILILMLKYFLLSSFEISMIPILLISVHALSRFTPVLAIRINEYVSDTNASKSKPVGQKIKPGELILAFAFGIIPIITLLPYYYLSLLVIPFAVWFFLIRYFKKWIGGYTGDCLGTLQQVSEIFLYLGVLIIQTNFK